MKYENKATLTFESESIKSLILELSSSSMMLQAYANLILEEPKMKSVDFVPNMQQHQKKAVEHAKKWLNNLNARLSNNLSDVIDFGNLYTISYQQLMVLADTVRNNSVNRSKFINIIKSLRDALNLKSEKSFALLNDLKVFYQTIYSDHVEFDKDYQSVLNIILSDKGELAALNAKINVDQNTIDNASFGVSLDAVGILTDVGEIVVGLYDDSVTGDAVAALVGVVAVLVSVDSLVVSSKAEHRTILDLASSKVRLSELNHEVAVANQLKTSISPLVTQSRRAFHATDDLMRSWNRINNQLSALIADLESVSPSVTSERLKASLLLSHAEWRKIVSEATALQKTNLLRVLHITDDNIKIDGAKAA